MRTIERIKASNILSFGPDGIDVELRDLNVLIGPNGSGKSNFLELFALLRSLPKGEEASNNLHRVISKGGGAREWIWKRRPEKPASIEVHIFNFSTRNLVEHKIAFSVEKFRFSLSLEKIIDHAAREKTIYSFAYNWLTGVDREERQNLSILSQHTPDYSSIYEYLSIQYEKIRMYREWHFGRNAVYRTPQPTDMRNDRLEEDFSNIGLLLSKLSKSPQAKKALIAALSNLYDGLDGYEVYIEGGFVQVIFTEGDIVVPAIRLSDGTLRYLCLLAILLDPTPPPIICLEEPEIGLHPDLIPKIAELLIDASTRTQLIITTHSDILIDALSEQPESVLVCEKHDGATTIERLKKDEVEPFLKNYRLGQLWSSGGIGGNRW